MRPDRPSRNLGRLLPEQSFARHVTVLAGSNVAGQLLALLAAPLLTRLYSPTDFGVLAIYMSITAIIGVVVCFRFEFAIALPKSEKAAINIVICALFFVGVSALLCGLAVAAFGEELSRLFGEPKLEAYLTLLPISTVFLGLFAVLNYWSVRNSAFKVLGVSRLWQVIASLTTQLSLFSLGSLGLVLGQLANQAAGTTYLVRKLFARKLLRFDAKGVKEALIRYRRFPLVSTWSALFNSSSQQLPTLLFAGLFSPEVAGFYALATRVINVPSAVFTGALQNVFTSSAAKAIRDETLGQLTVSTHSNLTRLLLPPMLMLSVVAPAVFNFIFGVEWVVSGVMAQWIVISVYFSVVVSPLMVLFSIMERQHEEIAFQVVFFAVRLVAILLGWYWNSFFLAISLFTIGSSVCHIVFLYWTTVRFRLQVKVLLFPVVKAFAIGLVLVSPALVGRWFMHGYIQFAAFVFASVLVGIYVIFTARNVQW